MPITSKPQSPPISLALVEWFEALFSDKLPKIDTPDRSIWFEAGRVDAAKRLRLEYSRQNNAVGQSTLGA